MNSDRISGKDTGVVSFGAPERSGGERSESERTAESSLHGEEMQFLLVTTVLRGNAIPFRSAEQECEGGV